MKPMQGEKVWWVLHIESDLNPKKKEIFQGCEN
jgi:hypothetical protein